MKAVPEVHLVGPAIWPEPDQLRRTDHVIHPLLVAGEIELGHEGYLVLVPSLPDPGGYGHQGMGPVGADPHVGLDLLSLFGYQPADAAFLLDDVGDQGRGPELGPGVA